MRRVRAARQRGIALLALLAVVILSISWVLVTAINRSSADITAAKRTRNAQVLTQAKQTLIGYVAAQAAKAGENNPGALPCPENPGDFDSTTGRQGLVGTNCGSGSSQKVGRFPWKTLGLDQLVDADGEPLWYSISPNWGYDIGSNTVINSGTSGQLTVDGVANAAVAVIIAPGAPFAVPAASGCAARNQARSQSGTPDWRDYLECENATNPADTTFVTTGPSGSFNDQVVTVTVADIMPAIEAAIAQRIENEIAPALKTVYASTNWGTSSTLHTFPFAAPFSNPDTSTYQGVAGVYEGLLPFTYSNCTPGADPRCSTTFHVWSNSIAKIAGSAGYTPDSCQVLTPNPPSSPYEYMCTGWWYAPNFGNTAQIRYDDRLSNVGSALRTFSLSDYQTSVRYYNYQTGNWTSVAPTATRTFNSDGSFSFRLTYTFPYVNGWGRFEFKTTRPDFSDHVLLDSSDGDTGWFVRNEWHKFVYYAVAQGHTGTSAPACTTASSCITVANVTPSGAQRAILILAGRSVNGSSRPSASVSDYLELGNATGAFVKQTITSATGAAFNDRIVVVDSN